MDFQPNACSMGVILGGVTKRDLGARAMSRTFA